MAERFCSQCGADLRDSLETAQRVVEERLTQSAALEEQGNLLEAVQCLQNLPTSEHSELAPRLEAARKRQHELVRKREQVVVQREAIIERAQRLYEQDDYAAAQAVLEEVPATLRDQRMRSLLAKAAKTLREINDLRFRLRRALQEGPTEDLLPTAERLLELDPRADDVRQLCERLRKRRDERHAVLAERLLKQARDCIVRNGYRRAEECLAQIPPAAADKLDVDQRKQFAAIDDRVWLAKQVRVAPYADSTLLLMAARLTKLQPRDEQVRKWYEEMAARLEGTERRAAAAFVPWTKPAGEWPLGAPVEPICNLAELRWDSGNSNLKSWFSGMRRHLVGVGLALHGVGLGRLSLELTMKDNSSWLQRLAVSPRNRARPAAWGLDFGTSGLKVVRLSRVKEVVTLEASGVIEYGERDFGADGSDVRPYFAAALQRFIEKFEPGNEALIVGFPGAQSLGRFFRLPESKGKKFQSALEFELRNQIPLPLDQVVYSAHVWEYAAKHDTKQHQISLVAAKKPHVELRMAPFSESTARVGALQSDCVALANLLLHSKQPELELLEPDQAVVIVEVGAAATNLVAVSPARGLWFRTIYRGVRSLNKLLVAAFGATWEQVDQLRRQWNGARPLAEVDRALAPGLEELTREVRHALRAFHEATGCRVARIYVAGGGCDQFGLLREWSCLPRGESSCQPRGNVSTNGARRRDAMSVRSEHNDGVRNTGT